MKYKLLFVAILISFQAIAQSGSLESSMYAVPVPAGTSSSIILTTATSGVSFAQVWLSINGGAATRLYTGTNRSFTYNAINNGSKYKFILYNATSNNAGGITTVLDSINVYGIPPVTIGTGFNFFATPYYLYDVTGTDQAKSSFNNKMVNFQLDGLKLLNCSYIRTPALGYGRDDANLWINTTTRPKFWAVMDKMMDDLDAKNIKLIPSFIFDYNAIPSAFNITWQDFVANDNTPARNAYYQYIAEYVNRYKNRSTILFWEISNELNLQMDYQGVSSLQMNAFFKASCNIIRANDPYHMISNGNTLPLIWAYNLFITQSNESLTEDNKSQFLNMLSLQNKGLDMVSMHFYPGDETRFGYADTTSVIDIITTHTASIKKMLFIGEYGDAGTDLTRLFSQKMLSTIESSKIPFSAHWIWSFYQFNTYSSSSAESANSPEFCLKFMQVNEGFGNGSATLPTSDVVKPQALITWPFNNTNINATTAQLVNVLAMDNNLKINRVELYINNVKFGVSTKWPFQFVVAPCNFSNIGSNTLKAIAYDNAGNFAADSILMNNTNANNSIYNVSNTILLPTENINGWTYYKSPYDNSYVFGIEANPSGVGANTNSVAVEVTASSLNCSSDGVFYKISNQEGIFASKDFFNTKITSSTKPNGWVNIRWFLDPLTLTNLNTVSQNFATSTGANYTSPVLWLKKINSKLRLIDNLRPDGLGLYYGTEPIQQNGTGTENGQNYYEFKQVSNIDGTGGAAFKRVSNIVETNSVYTIPSGVPGTTRAIRYNTLTQTFEGYDGNGWTPLH